MGLGIGFGTLIVGRFEECSRLRLESEEFPLDGNWLQFQKGHECAHESLGPCPTSRGTKRDLSRSVDKASHKQDEVVTKAAGYDIDSRGVMVPR